MTMRRRAVIPWIDTHGSESDAISRAEETP